MSDRRHASVGWRIKEEKRKEAKEENPLGKKYAALFYDPALSLVPQEMLLCHGVYRTRDVLEKAGMVFGDVYTPCPYFVQAKLPRHWKKVSVKGSSQNHYLLDEQGRCRAFIFTPDFVPGNGNRPMMNALTRFKMGSVDEEGDENKFGVIFKGKISDGNQTLYVCSQTRPEDDDVAEEIRNQMQRHMDETLTLRCPDWRNPSAYWDLPPVSAKEFTHNCASAS